MTERCQTKFTENFDNQNYIIYVGILVATLSALYFYRFHLVFILISYVLGCLACYFGLKWNVLNMLMLKLNRGIVPNSSERVDNKNLTQDGCGTCGSKDCNRHISLEVTEPWMGIRIHKQLDQAIEDFYNTILDHFINTWYSKITLQPFFVDELRHQLRYASANLLKRALKINYPQLLTNELLPCALRHYTLCAEGNGASRLDVKFHIHPAAANRDAELKYLRAVTDAIMPYLVHSSDRENPVFHVLIREIFAGWVLLSLTDVLADPYILNSLVVLATGTETMAELPDTPNYDVEFLETFVRQSESVYAQRCKLLKVDLDVIVNDQEYFYAFMQFMKNTNHLHMLQFYKDIKSFQIKILNPELSSEELCSLYDEASALYETYFSSLSSSRDLFDPTLGYELEDILKQGPQHICRLQRSRALYQASRLAHASLEKHMIPKFLHSEEFYKLILGSRIPTGYQKQMAKKPPDRLINSAIKLGTKLRGALKPQVLDGQLDALSSSELMTDNDSIDNMDILKYLDALASDEIEEQDLSTYKVVLTNVEIKIPVPPRQSPVREFTVCVTHCPAHGPPRLWTAARTEHDFHLLRAKLHEYHGHRLHDLPLPSRRDNSPLETLRYKYEDYLQTLLQEPLLQTSELLHLFLSADGDFCAALQATSGLANNTDLANLYQSVTHKLRKEKGQHLEGFLKNFLISSDVDRYQALKHGNHVEEGLEVSEEELPIPVNRVGNARDIKRGVFHNNFDVTPVVNAHSDRRKRAYGFTYCFMYLLVRIIDGPKWLSRVCVCAKSLNPVFNQRIQSLLTHVLSQRTLAHLIRLGHGLLFGKKPSTPRHSLEQRETARKQLMAAVPSWLTLLLGQGLPTAVHNAFEIIQVPQYNKQLVYNLLDLCLIELFPELSENTKQPKS